MGQTVNIRKIDSDNWRRFRAQTVAQDRTISERINQAIILFTALGNPQNIALVGGVEFKLSPHQLVSGSDAPEDWTWMLEEWQSGVCLRGTIL